MIIELISSAQAEITLDTKDFMVIVTDKRDNKVRVPLSQFMEVSGKIGALVLRQLLPKEDDVQEEGRQDLQGTQTITIQNQTRPQAAAAGDNPTQEAGQARKEVAKGSEGEKPSRIY